MNLFDRFTPRIETEAETQARQQHAEAEAIERRIQALRKGGYPERAMAAAIHAAGPGATKAQDLTNHAMGDSLLILLGKTGRGKTVMSVLLAMERQARGLKPGTYLTAFSLFAELRSTMGGNRKRVSLFGDGEKVLTSDILITSWTKTPFLVVDEVQTRSGTAWEDGLLDEVVNARYAAFLPTVLIANFTPEEAQSNLGPRIMDRARECGGIVNCDWNSYRATR